MKRSELKAIIREELLKEANIDKLVVSTGDPRNDDYRDELIHSTRFLFYTVIGAKISDLVSKLGKLSDMSTDEGRRLFGDEIKRWEQIDKLVKASKLGKYL